MLHYLIIVDNSSDYKIIRSIYSIIICPFSNDTVSTNEKIFRDEIFFRDILHREVMNRLISVAVLKERLKYRLKIISQRQATLVAAGIRSASWKVINHRPLSLSIGDN